MQRLRKTLCSCLLLIASLAFLTGCGTNQAIQTEYKPIYISRDDILTPGTEAQLLAHNCKVDYQPKHCKTKGRE